MLLQVMQKELLQLDEYLKTKRPGLYAHLKPPLSIDEIERLEIKYNRKLPDDLKQLYLWKNGQAMMCFDSFVNNSTFVPLEVALQSAAELTAMIGIDFEIVNWWNEAWIPIFDNGGGDSICYDTGGAFTNKIGQLLEFWHSDNDRNCIAPDLLNFIKKINEYFRVTPIENFDEYFEVESCEGYPIRNYVA